MKFPNPMTLLKSLCLAAYARWRGFDLLASGPVQRARWRKCQRCPHCDSGFQCRKCSCLVQAKISLALEKCPDHRWDRVWKKLSPGKTGRKCH